MDVFQEWVVTHWITLSSLMLLTTNLWLAWKSKRTQLIVGAAGIFCFWSIAIATVILLRTTFIPLANLVIDIFAVFFFYRLAERDLISDERHDWAGAICLAYAALVVLDVRGIVFPEYAEYAAILAANAIFFVTVMLVLVPAVGLIFFDRRILISPPYSPRTG